MKYYITEIDGYIRSISKSSGTSEVTAEKYSTLISMVASLPKAPDGFEYRLRADILEWELVKLPPVEPEPMTDEEALTRYANSLTGANDPDIISAAETLITDRIKEES